MGIKISELPQASSVSSTDILVVNHGSQTGKVALGFLLNAYLESEGYLTESVLGSYGYISASAVTSQIASSLADFYHEYLSECVMESDMSTILASYVTSQDIPGYISTYMTENFGSIMSEYLSENLGEYLSEFMSTYIYEQDFVDYLSEAIASALTDFPEDASEAGFVMLSTFAEVLEEYLSTSGGGAIYSAISGYLDPQ